MKASAILKNQKLRDDYHRCHRNKIDLIISITEILLEMAVMKVSGSLSNPNHSHYMGDRNKIAKMLKIIINYTITNHPGEFEMIRKIKFFGIQIYSKIWDLYKLTELIILLYIYFFYFLFLHKIS